MRRIACLPLLLLMIMTASAGEEKVFVYDDHGKKDPFLPLVSASGVVLSYDQDMTVSDLNLEGLVIDAKGNNLAIMNGKIVKAGDVIGLYTVEQVGNDQVFLAKGQEKLTVRIKKGAM